MNVAMQYTEVTWKIVFRISNVKTFWVHGTWHAFASTYSRQILLKKSFCPRHVAVAISIQNSGLAFPWWSRLLSLNHVTPRPSSSRTLVIRTHVTWCVVFALSWCAMDESHSQHRNLAGRLSNNVVVATSFHCHTRWCKLTKSRKTHLKNCLKQASPPDSENKQHNEGLDSCIGSSLSALPLLLLTDRPSLVLSKEKHVCLGLVALQWCDVEVECIQSEWWRQMPRRTMLRSSPAVLLLWTMYLLVLPVWEHESSECMSSVCPLVMCYGWKLRTVFGRTVFCDYYF